MQRSLLSQKCEPGREELEGADPEWSQGPACLQDEDLEATLPKGNREKGQAWDPSLGSRPPQHLQTLGLCDFSSTVS